MTGSGAGRTLEPGALIPSPLRDRDKGPRLRPYVFSSRTDQPVIAALLNDMRRPPGDARNNKERGKHRRRNAAEVVGRRAVKIQIGKELFLPPHHLLDALRDRVEPFVTCGLGELSGPRLDNIGARIGDLINAMAKAHDESLGCD